jgi:hypothetical protein
MMDLKDLIPRLRSGAIHPNEFDQIADILEKYQEFDQTIWEHLATSMEEAPFPVRYLESKP